MKNIDLKNQEKEGIPRLAYLASRISYVGLRLVMSMVLLLVTRA